jgi:hypothetical protein
VIHGIVIYILPLFPSISNIEHDTSGDRYVDSQVTCIMFSASGKQANEVSEPEHECIKAGAQLES